MLQSKERGDRVDKNAIPINMLPSRDTLRISRPRRTESEEMENHLPDKWKEKAS